MAKQQQVQITVGAKDDTGAALGAVNKSLEALEKRTKSLGRGIAGAFAGVVSIATLKRIADINMEFRELDKVLRQNTGSLEEFSFAQDETSRIADELGVSLDQVVNNFGKVNGSLAALGYSSRDSLKMVETISKLMSLEGADPGPTIARFNRAMSKGELHGARFNLMLQDQPALLDLIAEATGKTITELRAMSEAGELTADIMGDSLLQMGAAIDERFSELPKTIEQATTRIRGNIAEAFRDEELMQPVVDALLELAEALSDPSVREGLVAMAQGMAATAGAAVEAASELGGLGHELGYMAAAATGNVTYLDKLEKEIKDVDKALNNGFMSKPIRFLFDSEEELKELRASLIAKRDAVVEHETGISAEMRQIEEDRQKEIERRQRLEKQLRNNYISELKQSAKDTVKAIQERGKELAKAEKEAAKELELAQKETQRVAQKFEDVRQAIKSARTPEKEASVLDYYDLRASAEQALKKGDTEKAKKDAEAAAEVLAKLAEAGKAEYRFDGMLNDVEKIGKAAAEIEETQAAEKLQSIKTEMEALAATAKELEEIEITPALDEEALATVESELKAALAALKSDAVIPVRITTSESSSSEPQGFARGGYIRGPGTGTSDSILARLSDGEFVMRAKAVQKYGLQTLHAMNNMRLPGFADGGLVERIASAEPAAPKSMGTINFNLPNGDNFAVQAADANWDELKRAALKFGRPVRR